MLRSELARTAGCSAETLRHYESQGLPRPTRRGAGDYRHYEPSDVARVVLIRNARNLGLSLKAIRDLLRLADDRALPCEQIDRMARKHLTEVRSKIAQLEQMASVLERAVESCSGGTVARCRILEALTHAEPIAKGARRAKAANGTAA